MNELLDTAIGAAEIGGEVLLDFLPEIKALKIEAKAEFDFVTQVDHAAEEAIAAHIRDRFPDHQIIGEERGLSGSDESTCWIIDPLDGTTNYIHGVPNFAVSIAVEQGNEMMVGVVFDPMSGELFSAMAGHGAYLNGQRLQVSDNDRLEQCLLATGFPFRRKDLVDEYLASFKNFFGKVRDVRRMGAAAIDLAYVAAGRFDGFWEIGLSKWDFAAGVVLIREAGGKVSGFSGGDDFWKSGNILASNQAIHSQLKEQLAPIFNLPAP
jgi:myo-inositol-1(or 4)-monophosphatase